MDPLKFVKDNTYGINELNITPDQKVDKLLIRFSAICAAVAVQPIPFADIFILTPIQLYMGTLIAEARGYKFTMSQIYKEILGLIGLAYLAQQTAIGLYKTVLPFLGAITTIPLVFVLTYAIGKVMNYYFVAKTEGKKLTKEDLVKAFKQARKEGKKSFTFKGKSYAAVTMDEVKKKGHKTLQSYLNAKGKPKKLKKDIKER